MFRAVVFDMDGVIFDSETLVIQMWMVSLRTRKNYTGDFS